MLEITDASRRTMSLLMLMRLSGRRIGLLMKVDEHSKLQLDFPKGQSSKSLTGKSRSGDF
jgi:hypothetical protein